MMYVDERTGWIFRSDGSRVWKPVGWPECNPDPPTGTCVERTYCISIVDGMAHYCDQDTNGYVPLGDGPVVGASCDGTTDVSATIQAALDAGNEVVLPSGTCAIGTTLTMSSGNILRGRLSLTDPGRSRLKALAGLSGPMVKTAVTNETGLEIRNIAFDAEGIADQALYLEADIDIIVESIAVDNTLLQGVYLKGAGEKAFVRDVVITKAVQGSTLTNDIGGFQNEYSKSMFDYIDVNCNKTSAQTESGLQVAFVWVDGDRNSSRYFDGSECEKGFHMESRTSTLRGNDFNHVYLHQIRGDGATFDAISGSISVTNTFSNIEVDEAGMDGPDYTWDCFRTEDNSTDITLHNPTCRWTSPDFEYKCAYNSILGSTQITGKVSAPSDATSRTVNYCGTNDTFSGIYAATPAHEARLLLHANQILVGREEHEDTNTQLIFRWGHICDDGPIAGQRCETATVCNDPCVGFEDPSPCCVSAGTGTCVCNAHDENMTYTRTAGDDSRLTFTMPIVWPGDSTVAASLVITARVQDEIGSCVTLQLEDHDGSGRNVLLGCGRGPTP
jgi:hypothetical protein